MNTCTITTNTLEAWSKKLENGGFYQIASEIRNEINREFFEREKMEQAEYIEYKSKEEAIEIIKSQYPPEGGHGFELDAIAASRLFVAVANGDWSEELPITILTRLAELQIPYAEKEMRMDTSISAWV